LSAFLPAGYYYISDIIQAKCGFSDFIDSLLDFCWIFVELPPYSNV
jgi:hypothetical protein